MEILSILKEFAYPGAILVLAILNYKAARKREYANEADEFVKAVNAVIESEHNKDKDAHPDLSHYAHKILCDERHLR